MIIPEAPASCGISAGTARIPVQLGPLTSTQAMWWCSKLGTLGSGPVGASHLPYDRRGLTLAAKLDPFDLVDDVGDGWGVSVRVPGDPLTHRGVLPVDHGKVEARSADEPGVSAVSSRPTSRRSSC